LSAEKSIHEICIQKVFFSLKSDKKTNMYSSILIERENMFSFFFEWITFFHAFPFKLDQWDSTWMTQSNDDLIVNSSKRGGNHVVDITH